jgi:hypothetical protein
VGSLSEPSASMLVCSARTPVVILSRRSSKKTSARRCADEICPSGCLERFVKLLEASTALRVKCRACVGPVDLRGAHPVDPRETEGRRALREFLIKKTAPRCCRLRPASSAWGAGAPSGLT